VRTQEARAGSRGKVFADARDGNHGGVAGQDGAGRRAGGDFRKKFALDLELFGSRFYYEIGRLHRSRHAGRDRDVCQNRLGNFADSTQIRFDPSKGARQGIAIRIGDCDGMAGCGEGLRDAMAHQAGAEHRYVQ
jgi:hypothetical protein